VLRKSM